MVVLGASWLGAGAHALPLLPFDPTASLPLPGQRLCLHEDSLTLPALAESDSHFGCIGQRLCTNDGAPTTVVAVLCIDDWLSLIHI